MNNISQKFDFLLVKYKKIKQRMSSLQNVLSYSKNLCYWDYIQLETLLNIQKTKTELKDEKIFIVYHQMTELIFLLILYECEQLVISQSKSIDIWKKHLSRINRYYRHLISSFDIMTKGMDKDEFREFRLALLPASGFQSVQYRKIEIYMTDLYYLLPPEKKEVYTKETPLEKLYQNLYWKSGSIDLKSGKKTLTLELFEKKYDAELLNLAFTMRETNLYALYCSCLAENMDFNRMISLLRELDLNANLLWPLAHYGAANHFLKEEKNVLIATGGTNWQTYLPPASQKKIYFPDIWDPDERLDWGKKKSV